MSATEGYARALDKAPLPTAGTDDIDTLHAVPLSPGIERSSSDYEADEKERDVPSSAERTPAGSDPELGGEKKFRDLDDDSDEKKRLLSKVEETELTPMEAFKWNVEGDQSPCEWAKKHRVFYRRGAELRAVPEVAACVPNTDDPTIPCNSELSQSCERMWLRAQPSAHGSS